MTGNGQIDLVSFLEYLASKGLMNGATAAARKAAVNTLFSVLDKNETEDVTSLNLDEVAMRFLNKRGADFKPESVRVYKSRVSNAIQDFKKYRADPLNFKVNITSKSTTKTDKIPSQTKDVPAQPNSSHQPIAAFVSPSEMVFPIPIRPNVIVKIVGLPSDLTKNEAARIANVVSALATVEDPF
ncbi:MAG: hypothetical protein JWN71_3790 [Xanthobacteraceae bacterium]|nr:hypothetical protein [Xanthobacteraceae bacterium]